MSEIKHTPGPWKVESWGKSWMVMKPGPVGLAQYIRSPSGNTKFFRSRMAAEAAACAKNAALTKAAPKGETNNV